MNIHLNDYCERLGAIGLNAEPFNAISNIAFIIAGIFAFKQCRKLPFGAHIDIYLLCTTLILIGLGSGAWHLQPTDATLMLDIIPITLFINLYLASLLRRKFQMKWRYIACIFALLHKLNYMANSSFAPTTLNGTIFYLPTWLMLVAICAYALKRRLTFALELVAVSGLWSLSLLFRTIDFAACDEVTIGTHFIGTHFIWHLLNAIVLYRLLKILLNPKS